MSQLSNFHISGSKKTNAVPNVFRVSGTVLRPSRTSKTAAAVVADGAAPYVAARCLTACILYDERFRKRRVLLQYAHEVKHGRVLM